MPLSTFQQRNLIRAPPQERNPLTRGTNQPTTPPGLPAVAATATAAATVSSAATTAAGTAAKSATALRLRPRFVHVHGPAIQVGAIQRSDSILGISPLCHFHECKAAGLTAVAVCNDIHALY